MFKDHITTLQLVLFFTFVSLSLSDTLLSFTAATSQELFIYISNKVFFALLLLCSESARKSCFESPAYFGRI